MLDELVEIPIDKWPALRDLYIKRKDRPSCYNLLQTLINWKCKEPEFDVKIYSLNGEWESNGTFIARFLNQVFLNTCEDSLQSVLKALNCLDSSEAYAVAGYQEFIAPAVKQHFIDSGLETEFYKSCQCVWYHIPKDKAKTFNIDPPKNMQLKPLDECHAEQINIVWPHRSPISVKFIKLLVRQNDSVGLFEDNQLVAWCLILPLGALGILQVEDTHKRKGFGSLMVRYISRLLAEKEIEVTAPIVFENVASRSMFESLGFKVVDKVFWTEKPAKKK